MQAPHLLKNEFNKDLQNVTITGESLDILYTFAHCSGLHLIFGLNALLRKDHVWDSSNAQKLLQYCASRQYNMSWELGNEPNSFRHKVGIKVPGTQLGKDFQQLYSLLHTFRTFNHTKLYGPDIGQPRRRRIVTMLKGFLQTGGDVLDAVTWHHYYVNGRNATPEEFLSPKVLDSLVWRIKQILKVVAKTVPGKKVWLGETSSAYGGGAPDLSNTFIAGFIEIYRKGAVTMFALNLSAQDKEISLFDPFNNIIQFLLQPGDSEEGLHSQSVKLNGQLLKMVDHKTLPVIKGEALPAGHPIIVPAHAYAFYVVQDANAPACL